MVLFLCTCQISIPSRSAIVMSNRDLFKHDSYNRDSIHHGLYPKYERSTYNQHQQAASLFEPSRSCSICSSSYYDDNRRIVEENQHKRVSFHDRQPSYDKSNHDNRYGCYCKEYRCGLGFKKQSCDYHEAETSKFRAEGYQRERYW